MTPQRGTLSDAVVVVLAMAAVLSILDDSYASRTYLVVGLAPVALLLAGAVVMRRFHEGVWWFALLALLVYAPLGALVALQSPGPYLVPTFDTMTRVLGETVSAPMTLVSTVPPVDSQGTVMLVPFAIGFLAGAPTAWLALGTRSPLLPTLPLLAGLAAAIPLGVLVPSLLVPRGIALVVLLIAWAAARARRIEALAVRRRGSIAAVLTAALVVVVMSGLAGVMFPDRDETDRVLLRSRSDAAGLVEGAARTAVPPLVPGRQQLLRATGVPDGARLRFAVLDEYSGSAWVPAAESAEAGAPGTFRRIGQEIAPLHDGPAVKVRVQVRPGYASDWLPLLGELTAIEFDYRDGRTQLSDVRYNQATASALVVGGLDPRDDYTFTAVLTDSRVSGREITQEPTAEQTQPRGAFLDRYLGPFDQEDLEPLDRTLLLAAYLKETGAVRLTGSSSQRPEDLGLRLMGSRRLVATPFQYSALMALGASRLGVPARVVVGAEPSPRGIVEHDDVVSWVELQFADGTWRTLDPSRYVGSSTMDEEGPGGSGAGGWVRREFRINRSDIRIPKGAEFELRPGARITFEEETDPWVVAAQVAAVGLGLLLVALLLVPMAKVLRRRRRRSATSWSATYVNAWQEVIDAARDRGTPVPDHLGRVEQARQLGVGHDLARAADAAVFAPEAQSPQERRAYWDRAQELRGELLRDLGRAGRLRALMNPASLLAGWRRRRREQSPHGVVPRLQLRHEDRGPGRQHAARP